MFDNFQDYAREALRLFLNANAIVFGWIGLIFGIGSCLMTKLEESLDPWSEKNTTVENESVKE